MLLQILEGSRHACSIPKDNIGYRLLTNMGWTGGAVGKNENVPQRASPASSYRRSGLGFDQLTPFLPAIGHIIAEYVQSGGPNNLVFSPELTGRERQMIFAEAKKNHLQCHCHKRGHNSEDVYVVVSMLQTPLELVNCLVRNGGENDSFQLLEPSQVQL